jgi:hypothetical protein
MVRRGLGGSAVLRHAISDTGLALRALAPRHGGAPATHRDRSWLDGHDIEVVLDSQAVGRLRATRLVLCVAVVIVLTALVWLAVTT